MSADEREAFVVFQQYAIGNVISDRGVRRLAEDYKFDCDLFKCLVDSDGDLQVSHGEFEKLWSKLRRDKFESVSGGEKMEALKNWLDYFQSVDVDQSGMLSFDEVMKFCRAQGMNVTEEQLKGLDQDGSGAISFEEFLQWYRIAL